MVKWQGFFLRDHTENVAKYSQQRQRNSQRQDHVEMSEKTISQHLMKAFDQWFSVTTQLKNHDNTGTVSPLYRGKVLGYQENNIILSNNVNPFLLADILYIE